MDNISDIASVVRPGLRSCKTRSTHMNQTAMNQTKRRGRPRGTGKNDAELLQAIAEQHVQDRTCPIGKVIRSVVANRYSDEAVRNLNVQRTFISRRLIGKWTKEGGRYIEAMDERIRRERAEQFVQAVGNGLQATKALQLELVRLAQRIQPFMEAAANHFQAVIRSPEGQKALEFTIAVQALQNNPKATPWLSSPHKR